MASLRRDDEVSLIAEIKRCSPSRGTISQNLDIVATARNYERAGAAGISVLTEERFFGGSIDDLRRVKGNVQLPVLRKDFILNEYQIWESRFAGADAILLIVAVVKPDDLWELYKLALRIDLEVLIEVHTADEMDIAMAISPDMIGINNRDLETFEVDLNTTRKLARLVDKDTLLVGESGIKSHKDVCLLHDYGVDAILVGEEIVRSSDKYQRIRELMGKKI
jgi:indole-3-glycerol phosphate synthase